MKCIFLHNMIYFKDIIIGGGLDGGKVKSIFKCTKCGHEELRNSDH